jgi:hypothetical protein
MKVGAASQVKFRVLPFREKIQGLAVMVVSGNDLVEGIVLRADTIFKMKTKDH